MIGCICDLLYIWLVNLWHTCSVLNTLNILLHISSINPIIVPNPIREANIYNHYYMSSVIRIHVHASVCVHVRVYAHVYVCNNGMSECMCARMRRYMNGVCSCVYVYMCVMYICMCVYMYCVVSFGML